MEELKQSTGKPRRDIEAKTGEDSNGLH